jgi:hypothetical protein
MYLPTEVEGGDWSNAAEENDFLDVSKSIRLGADEDLIDRSERIDKDEEN